MTLVTMVSRTRVSEAAEFLRRPKVVVTFFIVLALLLGAATIARTPIGNSPDCWSHVYRIAAIYNGDIVARSVDAVSPFHQISSESYGGAVDWDIIHLSMEYPGWTWMSVVDPGSITVFDEQKADVVFNNAAVYTPVSYLPYVFALALCRATPFLNAPVTIYYAMQILGLVTFVCLLGLGLAL
ncbi:MAG: hypothetical protein LBB35_01010, partial [Coriobacteriaceae bacterium]|nr:hypothetical protein [Coriobacteriaceae bacterium]